ncbi:primosomal protein N' [Patescibacteria group bacterium]|nr:primosomal protein N' [Patescibacteria group bacterium]
MSSYVQIIVNTRTKPLVQEYTYSIPAKETTKPQVGQLVLVSFGRRRALGVIVKILAKKPPFKTKNISKIIDPTPAVNPHQIKLAYFISEHYYSSLGQSLFAMIPSFLTKNLKTNKSIKPKYQKTIFLNHLTPEQKKTINKHPRQKQLYEHLRYRRQDTWINIRSKVNITWASIKSLQTKKILKIQQEQIIRQPFDYPKNYTSPPELLGTQKKAWKLITAEFLAQTKKPILLFGRTGSGKTELYLRAAGEQVKQNKGVIILVPEIALVPQTLQRFFERFGNKLVVYHSQMSDGERYDAWHRLRSGDASIVVGSRSALFCPVQNLGLIIIDEEHEYSYKQDQTPRYHAVTVAQKYCQLTNSLLILGSATPRLETFWQAKKGQMHMIKLKKTISEVTGQQTKRQPEFTIADLRDEFIAGNKSLLSIRLQEEISKALICKKQVLLFLNRRGHATYIFCRECGYVAKCSNCYIPMTYHLTNQNNLLICHHCGLTTRNLTSCPECSSHAIKFYGAGTQRLESDVKKFFPTARILRMDYDTTRTKNAHAQIFEAFKHHGADILIGTQMIAKGWDIPNVDLIGIINADGGFQLPDFRSTERSFALLLQLIGRVGRGHHSGKVVMQTYESDNPLIDILIKEDYQLFAFSELIERQKGNFPPFAQLVRLIYESTDLTKCKNQSIKLFKQLNQIFLQQKQKDLQTILGPSPCFFARLHNKYRWHIILKGQHLQKFLTDIPSDWIIDVDPYSIL